MKSRLKIRWQNNWKLLPKERISQRMRFRKTGPMPEGSDAIIEAGDTYEEVIGEIGPDVEDDPVCEYDFLGTTGYGFEVPTEDGLACNFICAEIGSESEGRSHLFTILTTGRTFEEIDELLDLVEQNISFS